MQHSREKTKIKTCELRMRQLNVLRETIVTIDAKTKYRSPYLLDVSQP